MKASILTVLALGASALVACSSSNGNPTPTVFDSGADRSTPKTDSSAPHPDGGSGTDGSSSHKDGSVGQMDAPTTKEASPMIDGSLPDVGACKSDAATCNSCFTPAQDPLNACSAYAVNCIPFDNTRVPAGAP